MLLTLGSLSAQLGNGCFESLAETKLFNFNMEKSYIIIVGANKARKKLTEKFKVNPPTIYGKPLVLVD